MSKGGMFSEENAVVMLEWNRNNVPNFILDVGQPLPGDWAGGQHGKEDYAMANVLASMGADWMPTDPINTVHQYPSLLRRDSYHDEHGTWEVTEDNDYI